jgi:hypothetical protein
MSEQLTIEQAVRSGKDFYSLNTGLRFYRKQTTPISTVRLYDSTGAELVFCTDWLDQTFEIIEEKKELTASEIEAAFNRCSVGAWKNTLLLEDVKRKLIRELGF